jgi:hypothetical protein
MSANDHLTALAALSGSIRQGPETKYRRNIHGRFYQRRKRLVRSSRHSIIWALDRGERDVGG